MSDLEDILATPELARRASRAPDYEAEAKSLALLAAAVADSPDEVLQRLTDRIVELCIAGSAGISLLNQENGTFRWPAVSGAWAEYVEGTMPVDASPCGVVIARDAPLLFQHPHRHFPAANVQPTIDEILLVPFRVGGKPAGTLWAIAHDQDRKFDREDERLLTNLAGFASAAVQAIEARRLAAAVERTRAEAALRVSEERFRSVSESGVVAIAFFDIGGAITEANDAFLNLVGYTRGELEGGEIRWDRLTPPEWLPQTREAVRQYKRTGRIEPYEKEYFRKSGERFWALFGGRRIESSGEGVAFVLDITERKRAEVTLRESETRHRLLIESLAQAVWETDAAGIVVADSPSWRAYTGQTLEEWLGYGWLNAIHPDDRVYAERQWREAVSAREQVDAEFRLRAPNGGWRWTNVRAAPVIDAGGNIEKWLGLNIDIDDRKQAEAARRESEERYRALFESMDEAYAVVEVLKSDDGRWTDFRFLEVNRAFLEHTTMPWPVGKTATELLGSPNPRWAELYGQALDTGLPLRIEESEATLGLTFSLNIFSLDRERNRVAVLFTNITQRKKAEEALRASEERLRQFGEASQDVLWIRDAETLQWQYLTRAFETIYGLGREEALTGDNYRSWLKLVIPEDREQVTELMRRVRAGEQVTFDYRIRRPVDGEIRWLRNTDFPIANAAGEVALIGGIGHDATSLRETELRSRTLLEGIPQLVWRAVDGGKLTWASPQWTAFTGQAEVDSHGLGWLDCLHPDDRELAMTAWSHAIETGGFNVEYRLRRHDGEYSWFSTRATPVRDEAGAITEWFGTSTDVDDLRRLQEEQQVMVAELQHRTRNLIAVVRSIAQQTMAQTGPTEAFRTQFNGRLAALARVQGLLSRAGEERITIGQLIRMELDALAADMVDNRIRLDGPDVRLRNSVVQTLALALHELATNARKYGALATEDGKLQVTWDVRQAEGAGRQLALEWLEEGIERGREEQRPIRKGYGRELIERALPYALDAKTSYEIGDERVRCTIDLPLDKPDGSRVRI